MTNYKVPNRMKTWRKEYPAWISFVFMLLLILLWEILCSSNLISTIFLPSPSEIIKALIKLAVTGELMRSLLASLQRIFLGFILGSLLGLFIGLISGTSSLASRIATPLISLLYPIPKIALLPLFILWLGLGELSKVTLIALGVFFPVAINTYSGVKNIDPLLMKVAISFDASKWQILKNVIIPSSLPMIFTGLHLAAGTSLLLLVAAEMIAAQEGLGALILHYGDLMIIDHLMAGIIALALLGLAFSSILHWLECKIITWK